MPLSMLNHLWYRVGVPASDRPIPLSIPHDWERYVYFSILVSNSQILFASEFFA